MKISKNYPRGKVVLWMIFIGLFFYISTKNLNAQNTTNVADQGAKISQPSDDDLEKKDLKNDNSTHNSTLNDPFSLPLLLSATIFVLILIFLIAWIIRKVNPGVGMLFGSLPCLQILGRTNLGPKQTLALVKFDSRLILLGITDHQINQILTISDPDEVSKLTSFIAQNRPGSFSSSFKNLFSSEEKKISLHQESREEFSTAEKISNKNEESEVLQLQNELNLLIHKVEKLKGIGGRNSSD